MGINSIQIQKKFVDKEVVKDFTFEAKDGRITILLGPNGCGKTTWIRIALEQLKSDGGFVKYADLPFSKVREQVGVVFDDIPMVGYLNGYDNLDLLTAGISYQKEEILQRLHLDDKLMRLKGRAYSFGQRHRIAIAAAFIRNPKYLILDEPAVGIDLEGWENLSELLVEQKKKGSCILLTGHNYDLMEEIADDVIVIKDGTIFFEGSKEQLLDDMDSLKSKYRELFMGEESNGRIYEEES